MVRSRLSSLIVASCFVILLFTYMSFQWPDKLRAPASSMRYTQVAPPSSCPQELKELQITPKIDYFRRCIRAKPTRGLKRSSMQNISQPLFPPSSQTVEIDREQCEVLPGCDEILEIPIPVWSPPYEYDTSSILVGAATTVQRLEESLPFMARWLGHANTNLVVVLKDTSDAAAMASVQEKLDHYAINATLLQNRDEKDGQAQMHFEIVHALQTHRTPQHKWFAIIDDDTFFPSLPRVLEALEQYDPSKRWYIGAISERWDQVKKHGYQAIGGAGIFVSAPLLEEMDSHFDACKTGIAEGDMIIMDCVYRYTKPHVGLTLLHGLQQLDIFGNIDGVYEAGLEPLLSLHHYRSWHHFHVHLAHLVADVCGPDCFLQRYNFTDDVVLSNGYSVAQYPQGTHNIDFSVMEGTMNNVREGVYEPSFGAMRPVLEQPEQKISWKLEAAAKSEHGDVRQFYVNKKPPTKQRKRDEGAAQEEMQPEDPWNDGVFELIWLK